MEAIQMGATSKAATTPDDLTEAPAALSATGDFGAEIALVAVEQGNAERVTANEARQAAEEAQQNADAAQVQAMRDEASKMRAEGVYDATMAVGEGCVKAFASGTGATLAAATLEGDTKLGDGIWHAAQHEDEAAAAAGKAAADQAQSAEQTDASASGAASDYIKAALDFYRQYATTQAETRNAAIHRA